jgi:AAA+ ATPase superfamily predicted ATPase
VSLSNFIGRETELSRLKGLLSNRSASLIVVRGRRRIGKSRLLAEQNIRDLCFTRGGLLVREFNEIFSDLFSRKNASHKEIVSCLADGSKDLGQICKELKRTITGAYSKHLDDLVKAGFVQRDFTWNLTSGQESKLSLYRLSDNYLRFDLKYIAPNRSKIEKGALTNASLTRLPGWESMMGLQFENLVTHNRKIIWSVLNLSPEEVIMDGPFFQNPTIKQPGCQIDYMIQTRFHSLYLCEVKFSKNPIGPKIIKEMEGKRKRLKIPKFCSIRPVLIHANGVEESVLDEGYFDKVIDFGQLLG